MVTYPSVVVLGAINYDLIAVAPRFPAPGESVIGTSFYTSPGGKGGNQAVAAARLGARTKMVGRVGDDAFGQETLDSLRGNGVDVSGIAVERGVHSGVAHIAIDDSGQNKIVIVPGSNALCSDPEIEQVNKALQDASVVLLQMELPLEVSLQAAEEARRRGKTVVFDPAPAGPLPERAYSLLDYIIPNETEASELVQFSVTGHESGLAAARELRRRGATVAIVKLGAQGACYTSGQEEAALPPFPVTPVDTVAAGDAFNGAFAVAISEGKQLSEAVVWAMAAGAAAVTKRGAQSAMPARDEVEQMLKKQREG